jgi:hypothetical protein
LPQRLARGLEGLAPLSLAGRLRQRHPAALVLERGKLRSALVVAIFLREIRQKPLQVDQVRRVINQALRIEIVRVIIVGFLRRALCVLKHRLQPLANGRRHRRETRMSGLGWWLSRHDAELPQTAAATNACL